MSAIGVGQVGVGGSADGKDGFAEQGPAGVELARVGFGEGRAGEIEGEEAGVFGFGRGRMDRGEFLGDGGPLL